jgi:hypothetical protein
MYHFIAKQRSAHAEVAGLPDMTPPASLRAGRRRSFKQANVPKAKAGPPAAACSGCCAKFAGGFSKFALPNCLRQDAARKPYFSTEVSQPS